MVQDGVGTVSKSKGVCGETGMGEGVQDGDGMESRSKGVHGGTGIGDSQRGWRNFKEQGRLQ